MSGFVALPPSDPAPLPEADTVAGDAFWPSLSIAQFRAAKRIGSLVVDERARDGLRAGMLHVRRELREWKAAHVAAGAATLADIDAEQVDGISASTLLYTRAVFAAAAAELVETHGEISVTADGRERNAERATTADEHRRDATHAIRDILAVTRTAVELI